MGAAQADLAILVLTVGLAVLYIPPGFLAGLVWALLPVYGPSLPPGTGLIVCMLALALISVRCSATRDPRWLPRSTPLLLALAAGILVTVRKLLDNGLFETASLAMPLAVAISLFLLFIGLTTSARVGLLRGVVLGTSVISGAEALRVAGGGTIHPESAAFGVNPITIGQFAALGVLLSIYLIKHSISHSLHVVTLLICAAGLAATNSRGPLLGLGVAFLTMYLQQVFSTKPKRDFRLRPLIPLVVIMCAIPALSATWGQLSQWFRTSDGDGNAVGRLDAWSAATRSIVDSPILGQGADRYNMGYFGATYGLPTFPHNVFLEIWSEYGLIPFALLAVAIIMVVRRSGPAGRPIVLGFVVCFSISGSLDTSLGLWVALALALTLTHTSEQVALERSTRERASQEGSGPEAGHAAAESLDPHVTYVRG